MNRDRRRNIGVRDFSAPTTSRISHSPAFPKTFQFSGYLDVRTAAKKIWKRRYFVVNNNFLLAAATPHAKKLERVIVLEGSKVKLTDEFDTIFEMYIRKHRLYFRAPSPKVRTQWVNAIQRASKLKIRDMYRFRDNLGKSEMTSSNTVSTIRRTTGEHSATKIIDKKLFDKQKLKAQIQILRKIDNKYVVTLYDLIETKRYLYIVMEQCAGTIFDQMRQKYQSAWQLDEELCCTIVGQIVSGVQYMHQIGIVLHYLKTENILCVDKHMIDKVKIADFGISNCIGKVNITVNQMAYMAPELLSNQMFISNIPKQFVCILNYFHKTVPVDIIIVIARFYYNIDCAADSWSIGVIMFVLLVGYKPFSGRDSNEILNSILNDNINDVFNDKNCDRFRISHEMKLLLKGLLTKNPFERTACDNVLKLKLETHSQLRPI